MFNRLFQWMLLLAVPVTGWAGKRVVEHTLPEAPVTQAVAPLRTNLLGDLVATMDAAVKGKDPVADRNLLSVKNDTSGTYAFNTQHPAYPFHGVTGISVRGTGANCGHNGTLVAPRIVVTAGHCWQHMNTPYYFQDGQGRGAHWRFLDRNGKVHYGYAQYSRLLTNTLTGRAVDTRMFVLSNAMPSSVEPVRLGSPLLVEKVGGLRMMPQFTGSGNKVLWPQSFASTNYAAWRRGTRGGDSGSGSFVAIDTNLVLVSTFGGQLIADGVNWRETAAWLCRKFHHKPSIPVEVDLGAYE